MRLSVNGRGRVSRCRVPSGEDVVEVVIYYLALQLDYHHEVALWFKGKVQLELVSARSSWTLHCVLL